MKSISLQRLIRHAYRDGTYSYHYAPVAANQDEAAASTDEVVSIDDPADRFTCWPPQPIIAWIES
jgi:hypothetical protein